MVIIYILLGFIAFGLYTSVILGAMALGNRLEEKEFRINIWWFHDKVYTWWKKVWERIIK